MIFKTVNSTYNKALFTKKLKIADAVNEDYFREAFTNTLQSQYNKVYVIWNSMECKVYIDRFTWNDLQISSVEYVNEKKKLTTVDDKILLKTKSGKVISVALKWNSRAIDAKFRLIRE